MYYTPIVQKFDGYWMMRSPLGTPYHNQLQELKADKKRIKKWKKFAKTHLNASSQKNLTLFEDHHGDVKHLTASLWTLGLASKPDKGDELDFNDEI
jgi:hypothetical protein